MSKWVRIPFLVDKEELADLFTYVGEIQFYEVQKVTQEGEGIFSSAEFLDRYTPYVEDLKSGRLPLYSRYRSLFSPVLSITSDVLYSLGVGGGRRLLKVEKPSVQMQVNQIAFSPTEGEFRTQVYGQDTITWGIQLSFPHLFQDPITQEIIEAKHFINTPLFRAIQKWIRANTRPTPFLVGKKRINAPIRLGKQCFSWIENHPQLKEKGIGIARVD